MRQDVQPNEFDVSSASATLNAHGMHCHGCERIIQSAVGRMGGVRRVAADYPTEAVAVDYDPAAIGLDAIKAAIEQQGYRVYTPDDPRPERGALMRLAIIIGSLAALAALIFFDTQWISQGGEPDITQHLSLWLIFLLGLLTGFHCIGMCGGFVVGYTADDARLGRPSLLSHGFYAAGKTLSYTALGAAFGWLGAFVAFTPVLRGGAGMLAGGFLIVFGLNLLGLFAPLRRFRLGLPPPLRELVEREANARHWPFVIGLLNGLMIACGPLQAMYVMAAGTGSAVEGAKMLFAFGAGALPVLLAFGAVTSVLSSVLTHRLLKTSGVIVVALGAVMINRGLILTGAGYDLGSVIRAVTTDSAKQAAAPTPPAQIDTPNSPAAPPPTPASQTIEMDVIASGFSPDHLVAGKGVPVKWVIDGKKITTCNNRILVPKLGLEFNVRKGKQTIEFTPREAGVIPFTCWMGMLRGEIEVIDGPPPASTQSAAAPAPESPAPKAPIPNYVAAHGDTLKSIAAKRLGDRKRWRDILQANPGLGGKRLRPGQILKLPE